MSSDAAVDPWWHYVNCDALTTIERLAELLGCTEDRVEHEVRRLTRTR